MFRVTILDRYIVREMLPPFFLSMAVLLLVLFLEKLFRLADLVVSKGVPLMAIVKILAFAMPSFLVITIPMSLVVASLTAFSRLSSDSEVTALKASRVSLYGMVRPVFLFAVGAFLVTALTSLVLVPAANVALKLHVFNLVKSSAMVGVEPGVFSTTFDGMVIYVDKMASLNDMDGVFIFDERSAKEPYAIVAKRGQLSADPDTLNITLSLKDGSIHTPTGADDSYALIKFNTARLFLDISNTLAAKRDTGKSVEDMGSGELVQEARQARQEGRPSYSYETELQKRLSIPFACLIFGLIGAPLGIRKSRTGKSAGIAIALLVFLVYYIILGSAANLAQTGTASPVPAFWIPNIFLAAAAWVFVVKKANDVDFMIWNRITLLYYKLKARFKKSTLPDG
jgi:lipopolysaccharide export system permease protein